MRLKAIKVFMYNAASKPKTLGDRRMPKIVLFLALTLAMALTSTLAHGAGWIICDGCTTDTEFRHAAREAPLDGIVFVSNGNIGITKKFERLTFIEDSPGEIIAWISVIDLPISEAEAAVLNEALEKSRVVVTSIARDSIPGLGPADSVLGDIQNGRLSSTFMQWLRLELLMRGHFPSPHSVSGEAGITIGSIRIQGSSSFDQVRTHSLLVVILYADGSRVTLTFSPDPATIEAVAVTDADGTELPISGFNADGSIGLDRDGFMEREFAFGSPADELLNWLNLAAQIGEPVCRVEWTDDGVRVICRRT